MKSSEDPSIKVLAALTLYEIGNKTAVEDILSLAKDSTVDQKVKNLAEAIHDYWTSKKYALTTINK